MSRGAVARTLLKSMNPQRAIDARENLKGSSISVDVKNGVARLTGTVEDEQQRLEAAIAARSTPGVRAVQNDTRVSMAAR